MKLEEGMYVRTKDGYIFKIKELLEKGKYKDSDNKIVQRFKIDGMYQKKMMIILKLIICIVIGLKKPITT